MKCKFPATAGERKHKESVAPPPLSCSSLPVDLGKVVTLYDLKL